MERDILLGRIVTEDVVFEESRHPRGFWMPNHAHERAHFALVLEGCIETSSVRGECVASPACVQFVPAGETHASRYHDGVRAFTATFRSDWWARVAGGRIALESGAVFRDGPAICLAHRLYEEFRRPDDLTPTMLEGLSLELVATMARHPAPAGGETSPLWLRRVEDALRAHPEATHSISALAEAAGVHPGHLMRAFRQRHRCTIGDFVRRLRIERACLLLADPDGSLTLGQIGHEVGFSDQSVFGKTFKRATGTTPGEFRGGRRHASFRPKMFP